MPGELGFIGLVVDDIARSLTFYEHLGFKFPPEAYGESHVEVRLPSGLQIYWDKVDNVRRYAPDYRPAPHGRVVLGFKFGSVDEVDRLFTRLTTLGYTCNRTPWDTPWGHHYAVVDDPDGNVIEIYSVRI
jgi:catechol 2,3-dioxygenase-like lactoylglutathione lyase family enzyme